jgi:type IX secretion system PorP/SprF family membrane protein
MYTANKLINYFFIFILSFGVLLPHIKAQHEQQYTQFMFNKLAFNPAYAGNTGDLTATAIYRNQWMGFEGAPVSMGVSVDGGLKEDKIGLGMNIFRTTVGIFDTWTMDGIYSYKLRLGPEATLSAGLQASLRYYGVNFLDSRLRGTQELTIDPSIPNEAISDLTANFGFGLYFSTNNFYAGLSMPRLLNTNLDFVEREIPLSSESRHTFVMMGTNIRLNPILEWTPQLLFKYVQNAPFGLDFYSGFTFLERYTMGLGYRSGGVQRNFGESIDVLVGFQITQGLFMAFSYDILLTDIKTYSSGSAEVVLRYSFVPAQEKPEKIINPRYF